MGPFVIHPKVGRLAYWLNLGTRYARTHPVFHVILLCKYYAGRDGWAISTPITMQDEQEWPMDRILRHQYRCWGQWEFLVTYVGYNQSKAFWLPEEDL